MPQEDSSSKAVFGRIPRRFRSWRPSKVHLVIAALIAGVFGAYIIFQSFAADPEQQTMQRTDLVPGTGAVVVNHTGVPSEDLGTEPNPCLIWGTITDPFLYGCNSTGSSDPYIVLRSGDGDPHIPVGKTSPNDKYRRYISKAGVQSIYDATCNNGNPCNSATRTQTEKWSIQQNPMSFTPGTYAFYYSFRLQSPSPFPYPISTGGGISKYSQLFQFKSHGNGLGTCLPMTSTIGNNGIKVQARNKCGESTDHEKLIPLQPGRWIRLAVVAEWDSDGWFEVWADLDETGKMVKVVDRINGIDFMNGRSHASAGIGPYHNMALFDGTVAGQPKKDIHTDYANVQITEWSEPSAAPDTGAKDILISPERLGALPASGAAYDYMKQRADDAITSMNLTATPDASSPWLPNFNGTPEVRRPGTQVLAAALVYARTGDTKYKDFVIKANRYVIGTEDSASNDGITVGDDKLLATVRQIGAFVLAADLVGMDPNTTGSRSGYTSTVWKTWLGSLRTKSIGTSGGCPTMNQCSTERAHNWGTFARGAQIAIDIYLDDQADLAVMVSRMKRYLGDTTQGAQWKPSAAFDITWACVPSGSVWVGINPASCGPEKDGALVEDISRSAGAFPTHDSTGIGYTMEGYQSTLFAAILLEQQGYDVFNWSDQALRRTMDWLVREGFPQGPSNFSTDKHLSWIPRFFYKKDYPTQAAGMGRTFGFTDWLYGSVSLADTTSPTTSLTAPTNGSTVSGTVNITANASDNVGVAKVEFYRGSTKLGEDTTSPYSYSWNTTTVGNGSYSLTAKAYDAAGNAGSSTTVTANVSNSTSGCTPSFGSFRVDTATLTPPPACWRPYNDTSPFNIGVGTSPKLLSNSGSIVSRLAGFGTPQHLVAGTENTTSDYSHPIYYSKSTDPLYTIQCRKWVSSCSVHGLQVRIPAEAKPARGSDAHLDVVDQTGKWEYGFWETETLPAGGGTLYIGHGGRAPIGTTDSTGLDNHATAAHFGLLGGIIRASEMSAGNINHALFMVVKCTNGTYVWPASGPGTGRTCESMGLSNADAPAMGQHFYLDMSDSEINALSVPTWKKTILKAAAKYGMIVADTGGSSWGLQFESSAGFTSFGHSDPLVTLAQSYGIAPYYDSSVSKNVYVFNLRDGVDWTNKLRVVDPCVAQRSCSAPAPDTTAPTVSITSPANGATVNGIVNVAASASDNVGVSKVDFSLDGTFKLSDTASPYNYSFDSKTLANGSHTISAKAYDAAGNTKTASITVNVQNPDVTAPSPPSSLSGATTQPTETTQSKVVLDWPVASDNPGGSGIKGYYVYRGNTVISPLLSSGTTYTDNNVPAGSHTYTVRSVDNANITSTTASPPYNTTVNSPPAPKDTTPPSTPLNLSAASPKPSQVTLTWKASTDQGGSGLAGYNVYRNGSSAPLNGSTLIKSTSFGDGTVKPNSMYAYTVEAVDGAGNKSKMSPPVGVETKTGKKSDVNGDDSVDIFDLSVMASNWGKTEATYADGDLNGDGVVDIFDLSILASEWGS